MTLTRAHCMLTSEALYRLDPVTWLAMACCLWVLHKAIFWLPRLYRELIIEGNAYLAYMRAHLIKYSWGYACAGQLV